VEQQREYEAKRSAIRQRVTEEFMAGKIADEQRKAALSRKDGTDEAVRPFAQAVSPTMNGRGGDA